MKLLEVKNIVKHFGGLKAIDGLSFDVFKGESMALIGPNGAGKTTIFSLIMGQLKIDSGQIIFNGQDLLGKATHSRVNMGLSRTYQVTRPFMNMNILQNIRVGMMPDKLWRMVKEPPDLEAEIELAREVGFEDMHLDKKPSELSMGDLRKLELARTLATKPQLILLDEVFAGLTVGEIEQISSLINKKRKEGMTFVLVSHDLPSLEPLVERATAMSFGKKITEGTFGEVMSNESFKNAYLGGEI